MPIRNKPVLLRVDFDLEVERGIVLPAGVYNGMSKELGFDSASEGAKWTTPQYFLELSDEQLTKLKSSTHHPSFLSEKYDVSKFVRSRKIVAHDPMSKPA